LGASPILRKRLSLRDMTFLQKKGSCADAENASKLRG